MTQKHVLLFVALAMLIAFPAAGRAQISLTSFDFTPSSINVASAPVDVTVSFTASSSVTYFEMAFADPNGVFLQRGSKSLSPPGSVSDSVVVTFPPFSPEGTWKVIAVFLADTAGNTLFLDTTGLIAGGFNTNLTVTAVGDALNPDITDFSFAPNMIDTSLTSQNVVVSFTATDDLAGVSSVYAGFVSPSGQTTNDARVNAPGDFTAGTSVTDSITIPFPKQSEPGTWKLSFINIVDGAGNNLFLDTTQASMRGFPTDLTVVSTLDTQAPTLTNFSFTPSTIGAGGGAVEVSFTATDDLSGVNQFELLLLSQSGTQTQSGASSFAAATSHSGSVFLDFPMGPEPGIWTVAIVFLSDAAGNSSLLFTGDLGGFPTQLTVLPPGADGTPPTIFPTVSPSPNGADWNNSVPVMVSWEVNDLESGIISTSGCGPTTVSSATIGMPFTCSATSEGGMNSVSVTVKIDLSAPVTSSVNATPNPVPVGADLTITANNTDAGGSNIVSAEYSVDGGPFDDLAAADGTFDSGSEPVAVTFPGTHPLLAQPGVHNICLRATDGADNIGATECAIVAVYGDDKTTGGGGTNSPVGADLAMPAGFGPVTYGFNAKYQQGSAIPTGNLEFHYKAGDIKFKETGFDFLVVVPNSHRAQIQGTGVLNGDTVCKFLIDAWDGSFLPDNVDAFGLRIYDCTGAPGDRYNLPATPVTKGNIQVH